jgi:ATP-dependent RNA helicase DeaD
MKREVDRLSQHLEALGFNARGLHGDMEQQERDEIMKGYRRGQIRIMVATDVASRGLDVKNVSHVFNYHIPFDPQSYVHRIGRTGRAGKSGQAITLVSTDEFRELQRIQKEVGANMRLATIKSGNELNQRVIEEFTEKIRAADIDPNIDAIISEMSDMDQRLLAEKAISYILRNEMIQLGYQIGLDQQTVDSMMSRYRGDKKSGRNTNRRRR